MLILVFFFNDTATTEIYTLSLHDALPIFGAEITRNPGVAKISFTGSTLVGKAIAREAVDTMKRVTLELGGKSPNLILRSEEHTSELQSPDHLACRLLLENKQPKIIRPPNT